MSECPECIGAKWDRRAQFPRFLCDSHFAAHRAGIKARYAKAGEGVRRACAVRKRTPEQIDWRNWATKSVHLAVSLGWLPNLSTGEYACVDCGGVADRWEHRDYARVLDVDPVCHGCNMRRGLGQMPVFTRVFVRHADAQARGESGCSQRDRAA